MPFQTIAILAVLIGSLVATSNGTQKEQGTLQGSWISMQSANAPNPQEPIWVFHKGKITFVYIAAFSSVSDTPRGYEAQYRVDPSRNPKQIELTFTGGKLKGQKLRGIYQVVGDVLLICLDTTGKGRPKEFTFGKPGSGQQLLVFSRRGKR